MVLQDRVSRDTTSECNRALPISTFESSDALHSFDNNKSDRKINGELFEHTPGSMNRLFSDFFWKFGGVILEVFGTISWCLGEFFGGKLRENPWRKPLRSSQRDYSKYL